MPLFRFRRSAQRAVTKKSSSMGSLYNDYSMAQNGGLRKHSLTVNEWPVAEVMSAKNKRPERTDKVNQGPKVQTNVADQSDMFHLKKANEDLRHENNLLRLKVEILLDMWAQKTAEAEMLESDILKMKNVLANL